MNNLADVLDGWNGYQTSLVDAISPLTREQLIWKPAPNLRSVGDLARHIHRTPSIPPPGETRSWAA